MQIVARWKGHTCIILGSCKWWTFTPGILLLDIFTTWYLVPHLTFSFLAFSSFFFPGSRDAKAQGHWITKGLRSEKKKRRSGKCHWAGEGNLDRYLLSHPHWISGWTGVPDCCLHGLCPLPFTCLWRFGQRPAGTAVTCHRVLKGTSNISTIESFSGTIQPSVQCMFALKGAGAVQSLQHCCTWLLKTEIMLVYKELMESSGGSPNLRQT